MRTLRIVLMILALLLVVAAVVAWTFPASMAWRLAAPRLPAVQMAGVDGSIWHGHARQLSIASLPLGELEWELQAWPLLGGDVRANFAIVGGPADAHGEVVRAMDGRVALRDVKVNLPAQALQSALDSPGLDLLGDIKLDIHHVVLRNAWFAALDVDARWTDAALSGSAQLLLGDVLGSFSLGPEGHVIGDIHDAGNGPLLIEGRFEAQPGSYTLVLTLRARNPNDLATQEALQYVGQRQADGSVVLRVEGHTKIQVPLL